MVGFTLSFEEHGRDDPQEHPGLLLRESSEDVLHGLHTGGGRVLRLDGNRLELGGEVLGEVGVSRHGDLRLVSGVQSVMN